MTEDAATGVKGIGSFQYQDFSNMKPLEFDGVKDPIMDMRWISHMEGCFFTCSYPEDWKVRYALKLLRLGMKD